MRLKSSGIGCFLLLGGLRGLNDVTILLLLVLFFASWLHDEIPRIGKTAATSSSLVERSRPLTQHAQQNAIVSPCLWLGPLIILEPITKSRRMSGHAWVIDPPLELGEIKSTWVYVGRGELDGSPEEKKVAECWMAGTAECLMFSKKLDNRRDREWSTPGGSCCHRLGHSSHLFRDSKK